MSARRFDVFKPKKYGNVKIKHDGDFVHVILHQTAVVIWDRMTNKVTLNTGGWRTVTTKRAINTALAQILPGIGIFQESGDWFVSSRNGKTIEFYNGMTLGWGEHGMEYKSQLAVLSESQAS